MHDDNDILYAYIHVVFPLGIKINRARLCLTHIFKLENATWIYIIEYRNIRK